VEGGQYHCPSSAREKNQKRRKTQERKTKVGVQIEDSRKIGGKEETWTLGYLGRISGQKKPNKLSKRSQG